MISFIIVGINWLILILCLSAVILGGNTEFQTIVALQLSMLTLVLYRWYGKWMERSNAL